VQHDRETRLAKGKGEDIDVKRDRERWWKERGWKGG
jgi:hypothetical protein